MDIPSGNQTAQWKISIFNGHIHYKCPFSVAMFNYRLVVLVICKWPWEFIFLGDFTQEKIDMVICSDIGVEWIYDDLCL